jgi:spore coat protein U-like protein
MDGHALRRASTVLGVALALAAALPPSRARAAPACSFGVAGALAFGVYDPLAAAPADSSSTMSYRCPKGQAVQISLDAGLAGSFSARALTMGTERLLYNLYLDAARTIVWGDGTGGSQVGPGVTTHGAGGTTTVYVFGRVPAGQDVAAGTYADTIRVTFQL